MAEEELYSVFHQPTGQALELCMATLPADGTMLLGSCTHTRIKGLFPSENLKELHVSQFIKAWHYLEHHCPKDKTKRGKETGHFFYNVVNFDNLQKLLL